MTKLDQERAHQELRDLILGAVDERAAIGRWGQQDDPGGAGTVAVEDWHALAASPGHERLPLWAFGHSWVGGGTLAWWQRAGTRLGAQTVEAHGIGGTRAGDLAMMNLRPEYVHAWSAPGPAGLCVGVSTINDSYWKNGDAANLRAHAAAWRTLAAIYAQGDVIGAGALEQSGTWTVETVAPVLTGTGQFQDAADGTRIGSSTAGDYAEATVTVTAAGVVDAVVLHRATGSGTVRLSIDGVDAAELDMSETVSQDVPDVLTARDLSAGEHTARLTVISGTVELDSIRVRTATPPALVIMGEQNPATPGNTSITHRQRLGEMFENLETAAGTSASATYLDLRTCPEWSDDYWREDGAHFNNRGQAWGAAQLMRHLWTDAYVPDLDLDWRP